jgi:hypothetical protein
MAFLACAAPLAVPAAAPAADTLYAITKDDRLLTINSSVPAKVQRSANVVGLPRGERILGIDVRPATGTLMGVTTASRIVELNPVTGLAVLVASGGRAFSPALGGTAFGFDFNPTSDRIRIVSNAGQNQRIGPNGGLTTDRGDPLRYVTGDPAGRAVPAIAAIAYTNSVADATTTRLFGIDSRRDTIVRFSSPNDGLVTTAGRLRVNAVEPVGFDITPLGLGYASFRRKNQKGTELFSINPGTGRVRPTAPRPVIAGTDVRSIAIAGPVARDRRAPNASLAISRVQTERRLLQRGLDPSVSCDEECLVEGRVLVAGRFGGRGSETIPERAGRLTLDIRLNARARRLIRRRGSVRMRLTVTATDSAGNRRTLRRSIRTRDRRG